MGDFRLFVQRHLGEPVRQGGKWWTWHCQVNRPDKNPSLKVEPSGFKCFSCGAGAGGESKVSPRAVFLHRERGWTWAAAFREVEDYQGRPVRVVTPGYSAGLLPPSERWRMLFGGLANRCQQELVFHRRSLGRKLLRARGLAAPTWEHFGLGYNSRWRRVEEFDTWLAEGIVIPAVVKGQLWSLEVRTSSGDPKFHRSKGGREPTPFGIQQLLGKDTLVICEGAFDAMIAWQVCEGDLDVIGLRGAANQLTHWQRYLPHPRKIVAVDADVAGDLCADRLLDKHPTWERRRPLEGMDLGDMINEGILSRQWLLGEEGRL